VRVAGASGRHGVPVNAPVIASETQIGRTLAAARPDSPLAQLVRQPFRFEFFQAVRLIALAAGRMETTSPHLQSELQVAAGRLPYEEHIRFRSHVGHAFPASAISSFVTSSAAAKTDGSVPEMVVTFLGLAGTGGVLPEHYTQMLIDRVREKDFGLRDFWDLFNHRLISYFYRGWEKCHFYVGYEQARRTGNEARDHFTRMLYSLVGLGTAGLQARHALPDEVLLYYAGHFSHRPRSAVALQQVVADCFHVRTEVQQFRGQWMILRRPDRTRLTAGLRSKGNRPVCDRKVTIDWVCPQLRAAVSGVSRTSFVFDLARSITRSFASLCLARPCMSRSVSWFGFSSGRLWTLIYSSYWRSVRCRDAS
jgi:type VI secretion system ImpH/TssG family protein